MNVKDDLPLAEQVQTTLTSSQLRILAPRARDEYVQQTVLEILKGAKRGVTVSQVSAQTGFSRPTISKHLDILAAVGEAYKIERGNLAIYYKNGEVVHPDTVERFSLDDKVYVLYRLRNFEGDFIYIQECEPDEYGANVRVKGGLTIRTKDAYTFVSKLRKFTQDAAENEH